MGSVPKMKRRNAVNEISTTGLYMHIAGQQIEPFSSRADKSKDIGSTRRSWIAQQLFCSVLHEADLRSSSDIYRI